MAQKNNSKNKSKTSASSTDSFSGKSKKTIAAKVKQRLTQLDKKAANIQKHIDSVQKRIDSVNKLKEKVAELKVELSNCVKEKQAELDDICVMCSIYSKAKQPKAEHTQMMVAPQETIAPTLSS